MYRSYLYLRLVAAPDLPPCNPAPVARSGNNCATLTCIIPNLAAVCAAPNTLVGADPACINRDGPGLVATPGTAFFKGYCPQVCWCVGGSSWSLLVRLCTLTACAGTGIAQGMHWGCIWRATFTRSFLVQVWRLPYRTLTTA